MKVSRSILKNETGAVAIYVAIVLAVLLMFAALAIDVNHLYGVRNELHNAADGGALAGASVLFNTDGSLNINAAITEATRVAALNRTGNQPVSEITPEAGHWSFTTRQFTPAADPDASQFDWQELSFSVLDLEPSFINAVRVRADRSDTPSFFARILGYDQFFVSNDAVAYIGFAGTLYPSELDQPIAICKESITDSEGNYSCNMGRMLNSGGNAATSNTGGWTNFTQPCDTASASDMRALVCAEGNTEEVQFGQGIGSVGGVQDNILRDLHDCWDFATDKITAWPLTLPVVECPGNNVSNCSRLVGAVTVNVIWIIEQNDPHYNDVPTQMSAPGYATWNCSDPNGGFPCWREFVEYFDLRNVDDAYPPDGAPITDDDYAEMYQNKNIFFLPDCTVHEPRGNSGGENFGILARIPKLVE